MREPTKTTHPSAGEEVSYQNGVTVTMRDVACVKCVADGGLEQ